MNEALHSPFSIEDRRTGASLSNRARREHANRRRRNRPRRRQPLVVVDHAAPAPHLVEVVIEAVCRHRNHSNDLAGFHLASPNSDGPARRIGLKLQNRVVRSQQGIRNLRPCGNPAAADPFRGPAVALRKAEPNPVADPSGSKLPSYAVCGRDRPTSSDERGRATSRLTGC